MSWNKINHGGDPTSNKDKKYAIFIGRYQPYHYGHIELINQKLKQGIPALIMVRDIEPDEKNPFTTEQTVKMIEKYHESNGDDVKVVIIPDIESVNYGRGVGYEINEFTPPDNIGFISATKIRDSINNGDDTWKEMVDVSIQSDVINYLTKKKVVYKANPDLIRHVLKTLTYRFIATVITVLSAYILGASIEVSTLIGVGELTIKPIIYFLHERFWYKFIRIKK